MNQRFCKVCHPILTNSLVLAGLSRKGRSRSALLTAFASFPSFAEIPLKRATSRVGGVNIGVRGYVHGPSLINGNLQRKIVTHS
jgi:hypothetical protein